MSTQDLSDKDLQEWENQTLGADEAYVKRSSKEMEQALDEELNLQLISIRLSKALLQDLKFIAKAHGIGYQPMVRDVLSRFAKNEVRQIIHDSNERLRLEQEQAELQSQQKAKAKRLA